MSADRASTFVAGLLATMRELTLLFAPNINSYKRYSAGLVRADRAALGPRQPHLRAAAGRPRRRRCGWRTGCPAATSTPTWPSPALVAAGAARHRARAGAGAGVRRATPTTTRPPTRCRPPCARRWSCGSGSEFARAAFGDDVVEHYANMAAGRAGRVRRGGHRLGAASGASSGCEHCMTLPTTSSTRRPRRSSPPSPLADVADDRRRDRAGAPRPSTPGGRSRPATGRGCCAGSPSVVDAHLEELAQLEVRNAGHTIGNARWEAGNVRDVLDYYARRAGAAVRPADPGRRRPRRHVPRAARRRRRHRAVELPDADRRLGLRARARRRQHRRAQAGRADPADRDAARRAGAGGRPARGRVHGAARARARWSGSGSSTHPAVRKIVLHRLDRGRQARSWPAAPTR